MPKAKLRRALRAVRRWWSPPRAVEVPHPRWDGGAPPLLSHAPVFVVGAGRSGTHFLGAVFGSSSETSAYHLDDGQPLADGFTCWAGWQRLPMDLRPAMAHRADRALHAEARGLCYVEANPLLTACVPALASLFPTSRFVLTLRDPIKVIESHARKGWYADARSCRVDGWPYAIRAAAGRDLHGYTRVLPRNDGELAEWEPLGQLGRIAWMWRRYNEHALDAMSKLGAERCTIAALDRLDHEALSELHRQLGLRGCDEATTRRLRAAPPGAGPQEAIVWTARDRAEVDRWVQPLQERLVAMPSATARYSEAWRVVSDA